MDDQIDFHEFNQLLQTLENSDTAIRLRITGERWIDFSTVILLSEHAMLIQQPDGARKLVSNVRHIVEFQIDKPLGNYSPDRTYSISH